MTETEIRTALTRVTLVTVNKVAFTYVPEEPKHTAHAVAVHVVFHHARRTASSCALRALSRRSEKKNEIYSKSVWESVSKQEVFVNGFLGTSAPKPPNIKSYPGSMWARYSGRFRFQKMAELRQVWILISTGILARPLPGPEGRPALR